MDKRFTYPRESVERVFFNEIRINGSTPLIAEYALVRPGERPLLWAPLTLVEGQFAFLLPGTLLPGRYKVFVRVPDAPERSVTEVGEIEIT